MPWSGSQIFVAACEVSGESVSIGEPFLVAGEVGKVCAQEPGWASPEKLIFICDASGFLNPYQFTFDPRDLRNTGKTSLLFGKSIDEDFGEAAWRLSTSAWAFLNPSRAVFSSFREGRSRLYIGDLENQTLEEVATSYVYIRFVYGDKRGNVAFLGQPADTSESIARVALEHDNKGGNRTHCSEYRRTLARGSCLSISRRIMPVFSPISSFSYPLKAANITSWCVLRYSTVGNREPI